MAMNRVLVAILTVLAWIIVPVQLVTTLVLGILVSLSLVRPSSIANQSRRDGSVPSYGWGILAVQQGRGAPEPHRLAGNPVGSCSLHICLPDVIHGGV